MTQGARKHGAKAFRKTTWRGMTRDTLAGLILALLVAGIYAQTADHAFIAFDDSEYVLANPVVRAGFTAKGFLWSLGTTEQANWHPLTWWSHMLDVSFFGLRPGAHHVMSALLHLSGSFSLYLVLNGMTGAVVPAALASAVFAAHPLHVESVAWIAERKDVLSGLCWMLTLLAYLRYVRRPSPGRYSAVATLLVLSLMAKPMAVTLPVVLLLLDWWPLGRLSPPLSGTSAGCCGISARELRRCFLEKLPLLAISLAAGIATLVIQDSGGSVKTLARFPLGLRLANALRSTVQYQMKFLWPQDLGVFYPHPGTGLPWWQGVFAGLLLAAVTWGVISRCKAHPWLTLGWLWYLVTLAPVCGLIQVGEQAMADRYLYLPSVGLSIMVLWGGAALARRLGIPRAVATLAAVIFVVVLALVARTQAGYWRDSITLFTHTIQVAGESPTMHTNLGVALLDAGRAEEALREHEAALLLEPGNAKTWFNRGTALAKLRRGEEARASYLQAIEYQPGYIEARFNLALLAVTIGDRDLAVAQYQALQALDPIRASRLAAFIPARGR